MISLTKVLAMTLCVVLLSSCNVIMQSTVPSEISNDGGEGIPSPLLFTNPGTASYTCGDLDETTT
jgi:hypothetical protein